MMILMVNHDLAAMRKYIQHVLWLHEGKLTQGGADELLTRDKLEEMLKLQFS